MTTAELAQSPAWVSLPPGRVLRNSSASEHGQTLPSLATCRLSLWRGWWESAGRWPGHQARRPHPPCRAPYPCGLARGPGRGAHNDVDAAGRLGVAGAAALGGREPGDDESAGEAPLAEEEAQGGAGGRAQAGPDERLGPLTDAQVAGGGGRRWLRVQGGGRGA